VECGLQLRISLASMEPLGQQVPLMLFEATPSVQIDRGMCRGPRPGLATSATHFRRMWRKAPEKLRALEGRGEVARRARDMGVMA
jgi:hypothetical protein